MSEVTHGQDLGSSTTTKDVWDKVDILGKLLGSILIPLTVAIGGFYVNTALQDRSAKQKTVEIAVNILQSSDPATPELRAWAEGVFKETLATASQPLSPKALQELRDNPLPSRGAGLDLVSTFEGFSPTPVRDAAGRWTIGFGHTNGVGPDTPAITVAQAKDLLAEDMKASYAAIEQLVKVPLSTNQREALVSFVWSVGTKNFASSTLLAALNAGRYEAVPDELRRWRQSGGMVFPGLVVRRDREAAVWGQPN